jgi:hypothetical protein
MAIGIYNECLQSSLLIFEGHMHIAQGSPPGSACLPIHGQCVDDAYE